MRLRVSENRVLRSFETPRDEIIGGWRKMHNYEHHNLYYSPNTIRMMKSRRMRWAGHVTNVAEKKNIYSILVRKLEGMTPVERSRHRQVDTKMDLGETGGRTWTGFIQLRMETSGKLLLI
jgi:hypothetical protein